MSFLNASVNEHKVKFGREGHKPVDVADEYLCRVGVGIVYDLHVDAAATTALSLEGENDVALPPTEGTTKPPSEFCGYVEEAARHDAAKIVSEKQKYVRISRLYKFLLFLWKIYYSDL